jgi:hypothetical protein
MLLLILSFWHPSHEKQKIPGVKTIASAFVLLLSLDVKFEYISQKNNHYFNTHRKISPRSEKDLQSIMFDAELFLQPKLLTDNTVCPNYKHQPGCEFTDARQFSESAVIFVRFYPKNLKLSTYFSQNYERWN